LGNYRSAIRREFVRERKLLPRGSFGGWISRAGIWSTTATPVNSNAWRRRGPVRRHAAHLPDQRSFGERAADVTAAATGSWTFIWAFSALTAAWLGGNVIIWRFDPYPWQAYTASVSILAILLASLILLAGNRQAKIDRDHAEAAYRHLDEILQIQHEQITILEGQSKTMLTQHREMLAELAEVRKRLSMPITVKQREN